MPAKQTPRLCGICSRYHRSLLCAAQHVSDTFNDDWLEPGLEGSTTVPQVAQ